VDKHRESSGRPHYEGGAILLEGRVSELEACQAKDKEEENKYKTRQLAFNFLLVVVGALTVAVYAYQSHIMNKALAVAKESSDAAKVSADAAKSAAQTAATTLGEMKSSAEETKRQIDRLISEQRRTANSMEKSLGQSREAMERGERQSQAALSATIDNSHLDERAWVGLAEFATIEGKESEDRNTFSFKSVQIAIRNSGKTPATNLSAVTLQTTRAWREPIGDYDSVISDTNKQSAEMSAKLEADEIRRNPQMAESIRRWNQETRDLVSRYENELFPAGQVLAPGVTVVQGTGSVSYGVRDPIKRGPPNVIYVLGKVTYSDIFSGTKMHTTKFCLMRDGGNSFRSCPTGNWMD